METETRELNPRSALALAIQEDFERSIAAGMAAAGRRACEVHWACEAARRDLLCAYGLAERDIDGIAEIRAHEDRVRVRDAGRALLAAIEEDVSRAVAATSDAAQAEQVRQGRLAALLEPWGLHVADLIEQALADWAEEELVQDPHEARACAVLEEAHRRAAGDPDAYVAALRELCDEHDLDEYAVREAEVELGWWIPGRVHDEVLAFACAVVEEVTRRAGPAPSVGAERRRRARRPVRGDGRARLAR